MNEFGILMYLLTRKTEDIEDVKTIQIGALESEIKKTLGYSGQSGPGQYQKLLNSFSSAIRPFGLELRKNPLNQHWFVVQDRELLKILKGNPFSNKPRLAATLCSILMLCLSENGRTTVEKIAEVRKKKDVRQDLVELEKGGFIEISQNIVSLHVNIGYYLALDDFLEMLERL